MINQSSNFFSAAWLNQHLDNPNLVILDATMKKTPGGKPVVQPLVTIPGAKVFNFDTEICDQKTDLPHMLPTSEQFEQYARKLGINKQSTVVVYDAMGIFSSPRAWWMFKVMGHENVFVLDGGLIKWIETEYRTDTGYTPIVCEGDFCSNHKPEKVFSAKTVLDNLTNDKIQILDARSKVRFYAEEPEPRKGLKGGHIPGSTCLPFSKLLIHGHFKNKLELTSIFESVIKQGTKQLLFTCGSGVTACILALAADECGYTDYVVYDGSWSEWGSSDFLPAEI